MTDHDAPAQDEPKTPMWLTALGALLMLALAIWWLSPHRDVADATIRVPAGSAAGAVDEGQGRPDAETIRVPANQEPTAPPARPRNPQIKAPRLRVAPGEMLRPTAPSPPGGEPQGE